jgi:hypothetical protein
MSNYSLSLFLFISILMVSCQKGDTGPVGPVGPAGPTGPQGPQGATGTTNVIYSDWLSVSAEEWKDTTMANVTRAQRVIKTASALTQNIIDNGVILVYLNNDVTNYYQLPFTYNINPARVHNYIPLVGKFIFYEYATNGSGGLTSTTNKYRYILIPGSIKTNGRTLNWSSMNYKEVCKSLSIPE